MTSAILERIQQADNLPTLPAVAIEVLKLTRTDNASVPAIAKVIQQDPALTAKLLRVVNSSMFGMARQIASLPQAMVVLGLRTVKVMVLSFSLVDLTNQPKKDDFDCRMYWRRSLTMATVARLLADRVRKNLTDEAFVGGLLCDIGILAAIRQAEDLYLPAIAQYRQGETPLHEAEKQTLGLTHEELSAELLRHWCLPEELCQAVRTHHHLVSAPPAGEEPAFVLTRILRAAALLADLFVGDTPAGDLARVTQQVVRGVPISEHALDEVLKELNEQVQETASMFDLDIGSTLAYHEIQAAATAQLASLSVEAELNAQRLADQNRKLAEQAATDPLTGIANRAALDEHLATVCARCREERIPIGLLLLDLDHFKRLNDTFGHPAGDEVLRQVGRLLKNIQRSDRWPNPSGPRSRGSTSCTDPNASRSRPAWARLT